MQNSWSYIRDSGGFIHKINRIKNILVTVDVIRLHPCIPHDTGVKALKDALDAKENEYIPAEELLKMPEFVLKKPVQLRFYNQEKT